MKREMERNEKERNRDRKKRKEKISSGGEKVSESKRCPDTGLGNQRVAVVEPAPCEIVTAGRIRG